MNKLDKQYQELLQDILTNGVNKGDRTGTGTVSVFNRTIRHNMSEGFPLLTTKKMYWKGIVTELLCFLSGRTHLKYMVEKGNKIWVGDAYKKYVTYFKDLGFSTSEYRKVPNQKSEDLYYLNGDAAPIGLVFKILSKDEFVDRIISDRKFNDKWGDLGRIYPHQWRNWDGHIDQVKNAIEMLENNPDSRRILVNAWNPSDLDDMLLPPCHFGFCFYTRELSATERTRFLYEPTFETDKEIHKIADDEGYPKRELSLSWVQRSVDTPLGLPFNIASYGLLLELVARQLNMATGELVGNLINDVHIYQNQIDGVKEQLSREVKYELPQVEITGNYNLKDIDEIPLLSQINLLNYESDDKIKFPLSN